MKSILIGYGEIGKALENVLPGPMTIIDKNGIVRGLAKDLNNVDIMHICFPYSDEFEEDVKKYQDKYKPKYTVIHSTVKIGTSRKLNAVHSPIEGEHPYLEKAIKTSTKFLAGKDASEIAIYFKKANLKVYLFDNPETTELMKILSTTKFGVDVEYAKEVKRQCNKYNVPFEAWTIYTDMYNKMYQELNHSEYIRPQIVPIMKKIGGHCVLENCELFKNVFTDLIKKLNK